MERWVPGRRKQVVRRNPLSRRPDLAAVGFFDRGLDSELNLPTADRGPIDARIVTQVLGGSRLRRSPPPPTARRSGGNAGVAGCRSTGLLEIPIGEMVRERAGPM
jgi:hypothetical protein